jgi:hypothetical protein
VATIDLSGFTATIQVGAGTWTNVQLGKFVGGSAVLVGDQTTPSNVTISVTTGYCVTNNDSGCTWVVQGFKLVNSGSGGGLQALSGNINYRDIEFGASGGPHVWCGASAFLRALGNTAISGGASYHWYAEAGGVILDRGVTITITGTPAFSTAFASAVSAAVVSIGANTFVGSATGVRYLVTSNAVIEVYGAGATYLPGNALGSDSTGGRYI